MNFLVILCCLAINYLWLKDFDRFDDGWFFRFRCEIESAFKAKQEQSSASWVVIAAIIYGVPLVILVAALMLVSEIGFGIPIMVLHILVLLIAFDRTQPGKLASQFLAYWREADYEGAKLYLGEELKGGELDDIKDPSELLDYFSKKLIYRCFEKMFVMFFWYMVAGPAAVLLSYISYQMRDSHGKDQDPRLVKMVAVSIGILEWIPMRLLALTFSLAGNFVQCFETVKETFWNFSLDHDNAELLYSYSGCALAGFTELKDEAKVGLSEQEMDTVNGASRVAALQALLERSQAIWLVVLALITVFGL
ncbi:MAG: regulatory signaling modulator protein AmpE [Pseudohongiellaceae bacterium]